MPFRRRGSGLPVGSHGTATATAAASAGAGAGGSYSRTDAKRGLCVSAAGCRCSLSKVCVGASDHIGQRGRARGAVWCVYVCVCVGGRVGGRVPSGACGSQGGRPPVCGEGAAAAMVSVHRLLRTSVRGERARAEDGPDLVHILVDPGAARSSHQCDHDHPHPAGAVRAAVRGAVGGRALRVDRALLLPVDVAPTMLLCPQPLRQPLLGLAGHAWPSPKALRKAKGPPPLAHVRDYCRVVVFTVLVSTLQTFQKINRSHVLPRHVL